MKKVVFIIGLTLCLSNTLIFAENCVKNDLFYQLYCFEDSCISHVDEDNRCYICPEKIFVDAAGISLQSDYFGSLFLNELKCDENGLYQMGMYDIYMCNSCGTCYTYEPSECSICGETSFTRLDQLDD